MDDICFHDLLMQMWSNDARCRLMPRVTKSIWLDLCVAMHSLGGSVLRFGSRVPSRSEIARFLEIETTELESHLERLISYGLLTVEADGALMSPFN